MTPERHRFLELFGAKLIEEELKQGWHFCPDWDYMLVNKQEPEGECCNCKKVKEN
jgi:hypothetical protein